MTQGPGWRAPSAPPAPPEPEAPTTFCALLPRMPQWKFVAPGSFLGRGPAAARAADPQTEREGPAGVPALAAAVLGACEPRCAAPCPLPALNRCRAAGVRGPRGARGASGPPEAAADDWVRKGSFIHKPAHGWLHPDAKVLGPGVSYIVRYMGCIEVLRSMRSLDFSTRTQVTREAINRLHEAVPGIRGSWKKKAPNKALASILGKSNLRFAGMSISVNISIEGLNLSVPATRQVVATHHMQSISFASGGDTDMLDYVAYVAKDPINQRACHILECCEGLAQSVIGTVGQAFELRFKQYLHGPPMAAVPPERLTGLEESALGDEEEAEGHDYYNSIPGKEPPPGGLVDSRLPATHPCTLGALSQGSSAWRDACGLQWGLGPSGSAQPGDGYVQADARGPRDYEDHLYVNTQGLDSTEPGDPAPLPPEDSPKKDLFDMRPLEDALKLHACSVGGGAAPLPPPEDQWPSPPTRRAPVAPTEEQLRQEPWYHGRMSRRAAEKLLRVDGDFLVRDSVTNPGQYVLTGMQAGQPKHLLLVDPEGADKGRAVREHQPPHCLPPAERATHRGRRERAAPAWGGPAGALSRALALLLPRCPVVALWCSPSLGPLGRNTSSLLLLPPHEPLERPLPEPHLLPGSCSEGCDPKTDPFCL
ncbi:SHC adaptor protein 2, transcript variant X2 [Ictidomys tridecemlineatus]|uniref:SHC-transforming protein 2 isoform X2 n=1 Tax=Ictidomys tridecemlineatus TaxID=43179 RepID=UPI000B53D040|nr:SHC-transforming protein 2 isoform X2 [Ictidomys tridecemlineatus]KAG3280899.1 SHC adaptor protein 2, transcript variant X2 [Ictidomys tridecemlineatus]